MALFRGPDAKHAQDYVAKKGGQPDKPKVTKKVVKVASAKAKVGAKVAVSKVRKTAINQLKKKNLAANNEDRCIRPGCKYKPWKGSHVGFCYDCERKY
jgi:hypothetical protein